MGLSRYRLGEALDGELASVLVCGSGESAEAGGGGDIHDEATAIIAHALTHPPGTAHCDPGGAVEQRLHGSTCCSVAFSVSPALLMTTSRRSCFSGSRPTAPPVPRRRGSPTTRTTRLVRTSECWGLSLTSRTGRRSCALWR